MIFDLQKHYTLFILLACFFAACSDDSGNSASDSDKTVSGTVQGLIAKGATISVHELDEKLQQTGYTIESEATNDQGDFSIKAKDFTSQYALLKAEGSYRNIISGEKARDKATLYAFTDLEKRNNVNINILTHLSHKRAIYLATQKNMSVAKAKKQAETEVLKSFGINEDFDDAENLNIMKNDTQSIALFAISMMMQSDIADIDINERLTNYIADFEKDGTWDDKKTIADIADWAYKVYDYSAFATIKDFVKQWNSAVIFSIFEKYVNRFWHIHYGLGICTDDRKNEVLKNSLFESDFDNKYFICRPSGKWKEASEQEVQKFFKSDTNTIDGMVRTIQKTTYKTECQVYENGDWRKGNDSDCNLGFGGCTKKREGITKKTTNGESICKNQSWIFSEYTKDKPTFEIDTTGWKDTTDGTIRKGNVTNVIYIFDKDTWRIANLPEASLGKCSKENLDTAGYVEWHDEQIIRDTLYSVCKHNIEATHQQYDTCPNMFFNTGYYKCIYVHIEGTNNSLYAWNSVGRCSLDNYDFKDGKLTRWKNGKEGDTRWGNLWNDNKDQDNYNVTCKQECYVFNDNQWVSTSITQCMGLGECSDERIGTVVQGPTLETYEYCYRSDADFNICRINVKKIDSLRKENYVCRGNFEQDMYDDNKNPLIESMYSHLYWDIANDIDMEMSQSKCSHDGTLIPGKKDPAKIYVCDKAGFREATDDEKSIGLGCTYWTWSSSKTIFLEDSTSYYQCEKDYDSIDDKYFWNLVNNE